MSSNHDSKHLSFAGPAGALEAVLWTPLGVRPRFAAVVCHPHPLYGGTLHNKVVYQAAKALDGHHGAVLRFNFRGTGLSAGSHDRGIGEQRDVEAALDFLAAEFTHTPLLVGGFSFGSWVGLRAGCADQRAKELLGLGIPVNSSSFEYTEGCAKPKLIVQGTNDEHGAATTVEQVFARMPGEKRLVFVPDADHFFTGHLNQVDRAITSWLMERHPRLQKL